MDFLSGAITLFVASFMVALTGALMPGPLLTVTISESLGKGVRAGPLIVLGHAIAELLIITALGFGVGSFLQRPLVIGPIAAIGGAALIVTAVLMARDAKPAAQQAITALATTQAAATSGGSLRCIRLGAIVSLSSPYWILWWLAPGLAMLTKGMQLGTTGVVSFYAGHISADLLWYILVAFAVAQGVRWLTVRGYARLLFACAVLLLVLGGWFAVSGVKILVTGVVPKL
jgi:threonine/homoserine/homoserine lactone efflux protein